MTDIPLKLVDALSAWDKHALARKGEQIVERAVERNTLPLIVDFQALAKGRHQFENKLEKLRGVNAENLDLQAAAAIAAIIEYVNNAGGDCFHALETAAAVHGYIVGVPGDESTFEG